MGILTSLSGIFILGLIGGATPGPILTASLTEAFRNGFPESLKVILKAFIAEIILAIFVLILFFSINISHYFFHFISFVGAGVLVWLASKIWKLKEINSEGDIFSFKQIFLLTIFSGPFWIFWTTVCIPQAFLLKEKIAYGQAWFLVLFELGWFFGTTILVYIFCCFRPFLLKTRFVNVVFRLFSLVLIFFAIKLVLGSLAFFFSF